MRPKHLLDSLLVSVGLQCNKSVSLVRMFVVYFYTYKVLHILALSHRSCCCAQDSSLYTKQNGHIVRFNGTDNLVEEGTKED